VRQRPSQGGRRVTLAADPSPCDDEEEQSQLPVCTEALNLNPPNPWRVRESVVDCCGGSRTGGGNGSAEAQESTEEQMVAAEAGSEVDFGGGKLEASPHARPSLPFVALLEPYHGVTEHLRPPPCG
jgi:hypothetical protein